MYYVPHYIDFCPSDSTVSVDARIKPRIVAMFALAVRRSNPVYRGIIVYKEYQSDCPFVGIGPPTPSPASECVSPYGSKEGESNTPLQVME